MPLRFITCRWARTRAFVMPAAAFLLPVTVILAVSGGGGGPPDNPAETQESSPHRVSLQGEAARTAAPRLGDAGDSPDPGSVSGEGATSLTVLPTGTTTETVPSPSVTPVLGEAAAASPAPTITPTTQPLSEAAMELVRDLEEAHGVRVLTAGQNWGLEEASQVRNLGWLADALNSVPPAILAQVNQNPGGALTLLSNDGGRTAAGWQPYGDRAANFYTNQDRAPEGDVAANQIVLQPGSTARTIAHEMFHAYQMRGVQPGEYILALLTDEMQSFMQATGWRQLAPDSEIRAAARGNWSTVNEFFAYEGRDLSYVGLDGGLAVLYAPNPVEAYAEAAGLYYARHGGQPLPDWPEYWDWFDANLR